MAENLYEGMFLLDSGHIGANPDAASTEVIGILEKAGATVVANRPWQEGKLAFQVEGRKKGMHYLAYFRMDGSGMDSINRACRLNDTVLRHLVIKHPPKLFDAMVQALSGHVAETDSVDATPTPAPAGATEAASSSDDTKETESVEDVEKVEA